MTLYTLSNIILLLIVGYLLILGIEGAIIKDGFQFIGSIVLGIIMLVLMIGYDGYRNTNKWFG